jgi:hypothetical protein
MIAKHSNRTPYSYYDITYEHCTLINCVNNSGPFNQKRILIMKQPAFVMLPVQINGTLYDNSGIQDFIGN